MYDQNRVPGAQAKGAGKLVSMLTRHARAALSSLLKNVGWPTSSEVGNANSNWIRVPHG